MSNISTGETVTVGELREWLEGCNDDMKVYVSILGESGTACVVSQSVGRYRELASNGARTEPWFIELGVVP